MARKSAKNTLTTFFDVDFEVILIIVFIVVAILLVLFLNRPFSRESFLLRKAQRMENFQNENNNIPMVSPVTKVYFFYANWCGYSTQYLKNKYPDLQNKLESNGLRDRFVDCDIEIQHGKKYAQEAGVTGLPSFYMHQDGIYTKMTFTNGIDNDKIIEWLLEN
jgi:thiol-disulfide isomerase/thioredoxin